MKSYELILIFKDAEKTALETEIEKIRKIIEANSGTVQGVDDWGKREIAYEMQKHRYGRYMNIRFECANGDVIEKLSSILRIADKVLKFQAHRITSSERSFQGNPLLLKDGDAGSRADA